MNIMPSTLSTRLTKLTVGEPPLNERLLIDERQAISIARLFKVLANDTRLRLLHALAREEELSVTDLANQLSMAPQAVSNQLQRLSDRRIVDGRREGTRVIYSITDPCVPTLLDLGLCLSEETAVRQKSKRRSSTRAK